MIGSRQQESHEGVVDDGPVLMIPAEGSSSVIKSICLCEKRLLPSGS